MVTALFPAETGKRLYERTDGTSVHRLYERTGPDKQRKESPERNYLQDPQSRSCPVCLQKSHILQGAHETALERIYSRVCEVGFHMPPETGQ